MLRVQFDNDAPLYWSIFLRHCVESSDTAYIEPAGVLSHKEVILWLIVDLLHRNHAWVSFQGFRDLLYMNIVICLYM